MNEAIEAIDTAGTEMRGRGLTLNAHATGSWLAAGVLTILWSCTPASAAEPWPRMPSPPKSDTQWVAESMRVDGVPTRVLQFQSRTGRAEVADYYRNHWTGGYDHPPSVHVLADSTIVSQKHGPYLMTLKVEDAGHGESSGLIAVAQMVGAKFDRSPGVVPLMDGARVMSVVESDDPGRRSRQILVLTPQAPAVVANFYRSAFTNSGWLRIQANDAPKSPGKPAGSFLVFARDSDEIQLSMVESGKVRGTAVLANLVTRDAGPDGQ